MLREQAEQVRDFLSFFLTSLIEFSSTTWKENVSEEWNYCFRYVYKVCPFKQATQEEGYSTTRLG